MRSLSLLPLLPLILAQRGPRVVFSACSGAASQRFSFDGAGALASALWQGSGGDAMCLDISGFNLDDNATIYTWPCGQDGAGANERWTISAISIASQQSTRKCLRGGPSSGPIAAGTYLTTATCDSSDAQQALVFDRASGTISAGGFCVDAGVARGTMLAPCDQPPFSSYAFCDTSLPTSARVADAVSRMTLKEKIDTMTGAFGSPFVGCDGGGGGVPSLGVDGMPNHSECLHGVASGCTAWNGTQLCPTLFPNGQLLGAAFNRTMWRRVGAVIGTEVRAQQNMAGGPSGFSCWSPDMNLARAYAAQRRPTSARAPLMPPPPPHTHTHPRTHAGDPRWGRAQEVPGEDPFLHSEYGVAYATGMQVGDDTRYVLTVSSPKHFLVRARLRAGPR